MSDYTQSTFFAPKDLLATGNPNKIIYGSDVDAELSAISTAIATKADVNGDAIGAGTPCTELSVDNLKLDGNKIISTNTDGDIELEPDGTGSVVITKVDIADGEIDGTPIGANSASTGAFTTLTASGDVNFDSGTFFVDASADAVGIGTTSFNAANKLEVTGDINTTWASGASRFIGMRFGDGSLYEMGLLVKESPELQVYAKHAAGAPITFLTGATPDERMRIDSSGDVGIGTSLPSQLFHVKKDQAAYTWSRIDNQSSSASAYSGLQLAAFGNTWGFAIGSSAANSNALTFVLDAGGTNAEKMRIDSSGNVGVGTASPARTLHVNDVMRLEPRATAPSSPSAGDIFFNSSTNKLQCYDGTAWQDCF